MKALNVIRSIIVWIIVIFAVCMMAFTIISVTTFDKADRSLFGYRAFIALSDSMSATDFNAGDLVLVKEVDCSTLKEGDIIAYTSQNTENYGETVTHKIRSLTTDENGNPGFITYGTTTDTDDETIVTYEYVLGKYSSHIPKVGTFFKFLKTTPGYIICILVPFLILIALEGIHCVRLFKKYKAEQKAEIAAEKEKIEAERDENRRLMQELVAMKAQMTNGVPNGNMNGMAGMSNNADPNMNSGYVNANGTNFNNMNSSGNVVGNINNNNNIAANENVTGTVNVNNAVNNMNVENNNKSGNADDTDDDITFIKL